MSDSDLRSGNVRRTAILVVVGVLVCLLGWWIGAAVIPRWWAQRIGGAVDGRLTAGTLLGLSIGAMFTVLPIAVLALGWRLRKGWRRMVVVVALAALAAFPNLATLGIVLGDGNAAHAGDRILDVDGPGFRGGSLVGAIGAVVLCGLIGALWWSRRRNKRLASDAKRELAAQREG